jgi:hypothetical protein
VLASTAQKEDGDMSKEAEKLRRELARVETGRGKRYPAELRQRVVAWASRRHAEGASWETIKAELGQKFDTVRRWCLSTRPSRALARVRVVSERAEPRLVSVVSPAGFRIDGVTMADAAVLLRELG